MVGANSVKALSTCEDHIMHISCPHRSLSVKILTAKYGRVLSKKNICPRTSERQIIKDCGENNVKPNVEKFCVGRTECSFNVDNRNLGAFCVNVHKYLIVVFMCGKYTIYSRSRDHHYRAMMALFCTICQQLSSHSLRNRPRPHPC